MDKVKLYFYNGMSEPHEINPYDVELDDNYKGNLTNDFIEEYRSVIGHYSIEDMIQNQPLIDFNVFVNPTREQLQGYNRSILLDANQYLDNFNKENVKMDKEKTDDT